MHSGYFCDIDILILISLDDSYNAIFVRKLAHCAFDVPGYDYICKQQILQMLYSKTLL